MTETTDALVLDLVEWIGREPRLYSDVIETWRTSCPRLTIWEDAVDRGYVARQPAAGQGARVAITESGAAAVEVHHIRACRRRRRLTCARRSAQIHAIASFFRKQQSSA
jgi:hypothetical protein